MGCLALLLCEMVSEIHSIFPSTFESTGLSLCMLRCQLLCCSDVLSLFSIRQMCMQQYKPFLVYMPFYIFRQNAVEDTV